jgi:uncharacterized Tic20 family protein
MISVEMIVAYKNLAHIENIAIPVKQRTENVDKNQKKLNLAYKIVLVIYFVVDAIICICSEKCTNESYSYVLWIGIFNIIMFAALTISTLSFIK